MPEAPGPLNEAQAEPRRKVITFYAESPKAAFRRAEAELGPEAVLVATCRTPGELSHLGPYQVTFSVDEPETAVPFSPRDPGSTGRPLRPPAAGEEFAQVLLERLAAPPRSSPRVAHVGTRPAGLPSRDEARAALLTLLLDSEVPTRIAEGLIEEAEPIVRSRRPATSRPTVLEWKDAIRSVLRLRIHTDSRLPSSGCRAVMIAGPRGAGKTMAAARIAIHAFGDLVHARIRMLSLLAPGAAAPARLDTFCGLLGIPLRAISSIDALASELDRIPASDLAVIDTPGCSGRSLAELEPLSRFLERRRDIQVHLVLPATADSPETGEIVDRFEVLQPSRLLFTKLDLTPKRGGIVGEAVRTGKPLSFFSKGPSIAYDLVSAASEELISAVVPSETPERPERYAAHR